MASITAGYDLSTTTFSPDGKILQIEYASKIFLKSPCIIGLTCKDGIFIIAEIKQEILSQNFSYFNYVFQINRYTSMGATGYIGDIHFILERVRTDSRNYQKIFCDILMGSLVISRICTFLHLYTFYWYLRPLACSLIIGTISSKSLELYIVYLTGFFIKCFGCVTGENSELIKNYLEIILTKSMSCRKSIESVIRILKSVNPNQKSRKFEVIWYNKEYLFFDKPVSYNLVNEVKRLDRILF